jgi:hypothetical protein
LLWPPAQITQIRITGDGAVRTTVADHHGGDASACDFLD